MSDPLSCAATGDAPQPITDRLARADAYWLLARAFLPPPRGWLLSQWSEPLLSDLADLAPTLGLDLTRLHTAVATVQAQRAALESAGGPMADWLVAYSAIFLTPPVDAPLNTGLLLEGSLAGTVAQQAAQCYREGGFAPAENFRDLPDHVAMQLEFVAHLLERAEQGDEAAEALAEDFVRHFVAAWAPLLEQACQRASAREPGALVWAALAQVIQQLLPAPTD